MPRPTRIGLTGGIGSGKSTVAAALARLGAAIIDSDQISRELTAAGGAASGEIRAVFGAQVFDARGALDRARMRALVFADPARRAQLEAILHPRIRDRSLALARELAATAPVLVFDVPLLVEAKDVAAALGLDRVLAVDCPAALQVARVQARGTMTEAEIVAVIAAQAPRARRVEIADDVLVNAGSIAALQARVERLWSAYAQASV